MVNEERRIAGSKRSFANWKSLFADEKKGSAD